MNKYTAVTEHWRIPTLPMCLWKTRVGIHRWLLSCQLKSPKNPIFAGFYYQALGDSSEKTVGIRLVDSFLKLCSYLYWFGLQVHKGWYRYGLGKSSQLYREEPNGSKQQIFTFAVGNYTWGGTGKTPFVLYLSKLLVSRGYQPVILSRVS